MCVQRYCLTLCTLNIFSQFISTFTIAKAHWFHANYCWCRSYNLMSNNLISHEAQHFEGPHMRSKLFAQFSSPFVPEMHFFDSCMLWPLVVVKWHGKRRCSVCSLRQPRTEWLTPYREGSHSYMNGVYLLYRNLCWLCWRPGNDILDYRQIVKMSSWQFST